MEATENLQLCEDFQSLSFNSSITETDVSFSSDTTLTAASSYSSVLRRARSDSSSCILSPPDLRFVRQIGAGDIGSVYLTQVKSSEGSFFAAKVMDRKEIERRNKEKRAVTEREILEMLDHPFLPTLYAALETPNSLILLTEFCPGGDLHVIRQRQPARRFDESAVRFYASQVVAAMEYLHMLGIVYRDLKPENVLVRSDGNIMITDFDLSLKCTPATAQIIINNEQNQLIKLPPLSSSCILPRCIVPPGSCLKPKRRKPKIKKTKKSNKSGINNLGAFVAEPMNVRSESFVGTHEYLSPEIISGEGHGPAVDWWTLGVFIFELLYGVTPFKGTDDNLTQANIIARGLEFPKEPSVSTAAKDLVSQLLVKDPERRLGCVTGAAAIKEHSFFRGVNWALLRSVAPPYMPPVFRFSSEVAGLEESCPGTPVDLF